MQKRILRYAVEQGFTQIAWISGKQTAERYDLESVVSRIEYEVSDEPNMWSVQVWDKNNSRVIDNEYMSPQEIESLLGKDIAKGSSRIRARSQRPESLIA